MFKKLISICRVFFLGLIGIYSTFCFLVSYQPAYGLSSIAEIPSVTIFSCLGMISVTFYFQMKWDVVTYEYQALRDEYLDWITKQKSSIVFLVSVSISLLISVCQIGMIEIILRFTNFSIATASDISLFILNVFNFFISRTYIFRYEGKNYFKQAVVYTIISVIGLIANYHAVQAIESNFVCVNNIFRGFPDGIAGIVGYKSTPQFLTSFFTGWVWFLCHKYLTFRKDKNQTRTN